LVALLAALVDGQLDIAFVRPPVNDHSLMSEVVIREALVVALPPKHRFALSIAAVSPGERTVHPNAARRRARLPRRRPRGVSCRGIHPAYAAEVDHLHVVIGLVAAGAGIALVPASAGKIHNDHVTYRALHPPPERLETALAWRRDDKSPALAEFIATARRVLIHRHD
jgi:DNA-binding transcriptional LysR family regulator